MKVWKFYIKCDSINENILPEKPTSSYALYAFTNHKKRAAQFMAERDMKKFKVITSDIDKDDYAKYVNSGQSTQMYELKYLPFQNKVVTNSDSYDYAYVRLLTTTYEHMSCSEEEFGVQSCEVYNEEWWLGMPPIDMLEKSFGKNLDILRYSKMYELFNPTAFIKSSNAENGYDLISPDVMLDEVALFIKFYKDTLA